MSGSHDHGVSELKFEKPLWWALGLTATFLVAEVIGGLITNSLALLSDAAHMMTDVIALGVSLFAVRMAKRPADSNKTYGYARMEALGALINGGLLFLVAGYILWEAVGRFRQPPEVASTGMFVVAVIGLVVNLVSMRLLKAGSGDSLNVKGAYLEVWSDMLGSIGVIVGAIVIRYTGWTLIDPIIAVAIGLWVLPRTWTLLRAASHILMQGTPSEIEVEDVRAALMRNRSVGEVHDLHVWSVSSQRPVLTAHVVLKEQSDPVDQVRRDLSAELDELFGIEEVTLQIEQASCANKGHRHGHS
ncbi:cation diffusion facilitator family transporter [Xanthomonas nasturtii]|uniref:Cation transporter n=1 Tax=Xanthomonas nasturtii TaxID=1843581 RepID=A0A3E1KFB6_9XANT|nr:cation diffusion facilitator family transporter [Xanthomonas nasturtii]MCL1500294.1 cation diffusion facilitator family transporter [Xanthomonas nasturtii]MCL1504228.1 cation diffusion facilitator family transporter [Xanthomonas nasturtii]MCL1523074.1 cation diffusion facilitator family transporter [Xanthomonas nasturtii]MCL1530977.1 cation diffusion facilitator family transporter [Xanthomonas nasturtii]MCL1565794.1 cation diffusion facilitator family transporter [Xanthomonas nasturtii]